MNDMQTEAYFRNMNALVRSEGWRELLQEFDDLLDLWNDVTTINNENDLYYRKGQIDTINRLCNLEFELEAAQESYESA